MPLTIFLIVISVFSIFFTARLYRAATPEQRGQIVFAGIGAAVVALAIGVLMYFR